MASKIPVMCPNCGTHVRKNGYCPACYMHINVAKKAQNTSDYYYNIGLDKAMARDLSGAVDSLNMSLRYNKKNVAARNLIGLVYYEMGETIKALSHWVMSINFRENDNRATAYLKELKVDPTCMENADQIAKKYNMALEYAWSEDYDLAILQLKNAISLNNHFVNGYLLLALLYIRVNNYEKARTTLRRILKIDKANPMAIHYLHEMGDSDENIIQMRMKLETENVENDGLLEDEYLESYKEIAVTDEDSERKRNHMWLKHIIEQSKKHSVVSSDEYSDYQFARYSGIYVLVGLVLGILILYFVIVPAQKHKIKQDNENLIKTYSEELATKNAQITTLNNQVADLQQQIENITLQDYGSDNPLPDYSSIESGMSEYDLQNLLQGE